jgi:hypothetical protein
MDLILIPWQENQRVKRIEEQESKTSRRHRHSHWPGSELKLVISCSRHVILGSVLCMHLGHIIVHLCSLLTRREIKQITALECDSVANTCSMKSYIL